MSPSVTFLFGLILLGLFGWYFATDSESRKRSLGLTLIVLLVAVCIGIIYPPDKKIKKGLDLAGGTEFLIRLVKDNPDSQITKPALDNAVEVIRSRVDKFGVGEPVISPVGTDQILVQIPGLETEQVNEVRDTIKRVAKLEFKLVDPRSAQLIPQIEAGTAIVPPGYQVVTEERDDVDPSLSAPGAKPTHKSISKYLVKKRADMSGERVVAARASQGQMNGAWEVNLRFDSVGAKQFGDITQAHVGDLLAILLDGKVVSAPQLRGAIYGGSAQITGNFTQASANTLSSALENPLATPVRVEQETNVSATLGKDAINSGIKSGVIGLLLTFAFVLVYYRFAGVLASVALLVNIVILFGLLVSWGSVLTLPGIAGIILTIGLAIDANVLIYERLREELDSGKALRPALDGAYRKAFTSIFDANVTTLITSVILYLYAAGPVRGFAVTLTLGIIASLFSALLVTRNGFAWATDKFGLTRIRMMHFFENPHFDFMSKARLCALASILVIGASVAVFAYRGDKNFGIDFKGGDLTVMTTQKKLDVGQMRESLRAEGQEEAVIQPQERNGKQLITIRSSIDSGVKVQKRLMETFPDAGLHLEQYNKVGALVGRQLAIKSLVALGLGVLGILIYVSLRFEFSFALGAIVALLHDVVITIGVFALLGRELSLVMVGAVLTIAGYSINDTIVVYDRIRSGLREGRKGSVREIMNASINETLGRTMLTGGMTLVTVLALYIGGGPVLHDFALAILIGVLVGTYSSVFVASPIVLWFSRGEKGRLRREVSRTTDPAGGGDSGGGDSTPREALPVGRG